MTTVARCYRRGHMRQFINLLGLLVVGTMVSPAWAQDDAAVQFADAGPIFDAALVDAMLTADAALVVDAGSLSDANPGCGAVTYKGECIGDVLRYCQGGQLVEIDCGDPASYPRGGPTVTCGLLDCTDPGCQGFWCVAKPDSPCGALRCDISLQMACVDGICQNSEDCTGAEFAPFCAGSVWTYCAGLINNYDCSVAGTAPYTCQDSDSQSSPCLGLVGATCDVLTGHLCDAELNCVNGLCVGAPDAGDLDPDAGEIDANLDAGKTDRASDDKPADPGCGCEQRVNSNKHWLQGVFCLTLFGVAFGARQRRKRSRAL